MRVLRSSKSPPFEPTLSFGVLICQPAFGIERGHATGAGHCQRLAIALQTITFRFF